VQKAPDDAALTDKPFEVPVIPSVPPPAPSRPKKSADGPKSRAGDRRRGRVAIPDDPIPPAAPVIPQAAPVPKGVGAVPGPASDGDRSPANGATQAEARRPTSEAPKSGPVGVSRPMQAETAFERMTQGTSVPLPDPKAKPPSVAPDVSTEVLPRFRILSERSEAPTSSSPLTYREMAFGVAETTSTKDAEAIVRAQFEVVRASLRNAPKGQFIALAVFDHEFDGKPKRLPLATLSFKDWRDPEPVVRFPLRDARSSTNAPPPSEPPSPADLGQTQVNPATNVPIDAKRSDDQLPKVDAGAARRSAAPASVAPASGGAPTDATKGAGASASVEAPRASAAPPSAKPEGATRDSAPPSKRKPPVPTPSQIRRAAVEMAPEEVTEVKEPEAIPEPPESLTQVMPPPVADAAPATKASTPEPDDVEVSVEPVDEAPSDAPTPAIAPKHVAPEAPQEVVKRASERPGTERGVFPAVTLPTGIAPLAPPPGAAAFGVTAPAEPLSSAMRPLSQPPGPAPRRGSVPPEGAGVAAKAVDAKAVDANAVDANAVDAQAVDAKTVDAKTVDAKAVDANAVDAKAVDAKAVDANAVDARGEATPPVSNPRDTERAGSQPPVSGPEPVAASVPPTSGAQASKRPSAAPAKERVRDDDLISELFEALCDLEFLADPLEGADFVLGVALENLPSEIGMVSFFSLDSREFVVVRANQDAPAGLLLARAGERASLLSKAMRTNQAVVLGDGAAAEVADDPRWKATGIEPTSLVCAPVKLGGRYLGLIELANPLDGAPYTHGDGHAISYIAQQFAEFLGQRDVVLDADRITAPKLAARMRR
jgi:hypothetical protein